MAVTVQNEHMAQGDWSVEVDWSPALQAELMDDDKRPRKVHALIYDTSTDPDTLIDCGVLLRVAGDDQGLRIGGRGLLWWLGAGDTGRIIIDREFIAGTNKLSNPIFALGDLYWQTGEGTNWSFVTGAAITSTAPTEDDILVSSESWPVRGGQQYRQTITARRYFGSELIGRLRLRRIDKGRFTHPQRASGYELWTASTHGDITVSTDPTKVIDGQSHVLKIHTPDRELLTNNSFDSGLTGWFDEQAPPGDWDTVAAPDGVCARTTPSAAMTKGLRGLNPNGVGPDFLFPVVEGEEYALGGWISQAVGTTGNASISALVGDITTGVWENANEKVGTGDLAWYHDHTTITIRDKPAAASTMKPVLLVHNHTAGAWYFDNVYLFRTRGNTDYVRAPGFAALPGRSYTAKVKFRTDPEVTGTVQLRASCVSIDRPGIIIDGPTLGNTDGEVIESQPWEMVAPSGYDMIIPWVFSQDVKGGVYWVGEWDIRETDATTRWQDVYTPATYGTHTVSLDRTVPLGTDSVSVEVVAEESAAGWGLTSVAFQRINVSPATGDAIVASLLTNMPLTTGMVNCPEVIPYDWRVLNLTPREALEHYCDVVSEPPREYRVNPDRSLDVVSAVPGTVFVDHAPGSASPIVLLPEDIDVEALPEVEADVEERVTEIRVIGAEVTRPDGSTFNIEASAEVPGALEYDWNGYPIRRTRLVIDGTMDHRGVAQAFADDLAAKEAEPALSVNATLTGTNTRPAFREGDWIYVYDPEAGLEDVDNVVTIEGRTVFPRRVRVLGRTRELGPSHRIDIRRTNGTTFTLGGVRWSEEDATSLTIGDRRPEWQADPQGHSASTQYLRDRVSAPR